ncbi:MAG: OmpA family protein [Bacteroidia bacterium]|nr:OmpA family protein [Bacteroidia bacterium]
MKKIILHIILSTAPLLLCAQQDLTLYNMPDISQATYVNPSLMPVNRYYIGLPVIHSNYALISNSSFTYHDFYKLRPDDSVFIDIDNVMSKLKKNNYLKTSYRTDLLSFGFRVNKSYFTANASEYINFAFAYSKELIELLEKGNGPFIGEKLDFSKLGFDATHYREYAVGWAYELNSKWTTGIRFKYLYGMENYSSSTGDLSIYTASDDYSLQATSDIVIRTSSLENSEEGYAQFDTSDSKVQSQYINDYLFSRDNKGFAFDLGASYKHNDQWNFSLSILDLGYIKWNEDVKNYKTSSGIYEFAGIDINSFLNDTSTDVGAVADSLADTFTSVETSEAYKSNLPAHLYLGANYVINDKSFAGGVFHAEFFKKTIQPSVTLSYNLKVGRHLTTSVSYSYLNQSFDNIGIGLAASAGPVQLYATTDNVLGTIAPLDFRNAQVHFGINIILGRPFKDRDKDKVSDKKDDCPEIPGVIALNGCPDVDLDGVPDKDDKCPDVAGLVALQGCPDKDNDKIIDKEDKCPADSGLAIYSGCPDTDMDSIPDPEDDCITEKGLLVNKGCPDTDADGIIDRQDSCVLVPGPLSNNGCPVIEKVVVPVAVQLTKEEQEIINKVFSNLEFETGKAVIRKASYPALDELASLLQRKPTFRILIEGHTDNTGSAQTNMRISLNRANAVKKYLTDKGITEERVIAKGYGLTQPIAPNTTSQGRQKNRRVEFTVLE